LVAHLHFLPTQKPNKKMQKSYQANAPKTLKTMDRQASTERTPAGNSGFAKKRVQWLNEVQFSNQTFVQVDSFVLRNPLLRKAAKRYPTYLKWETIIEYQIMQSRLTAMIKN
jgi:hypothetical protein